MKSRIVTTILKLGFFLALFILSINYLHDFDIWFHIKSGELISQRGIFYTDVFSHSAYGREWYPYEWLFQVLVYKTSALFGIYSLTVLTAFIVLAHLLVLYRILTRILKLTWSYSLCVIFVYFVSVYEFLTPRPHLVAYTLLLINLYFILEYFQNNRNYLWLTFPITLVWSNMHASIFLDICLFFGYSFSSFILTLINRKKEFLKKSMVLAFVGIISFVLSVLPPLGFLQYKLLLNFAREQNTLSQFISEWAPLSTNPEEFGLFIATVVFIFCFFFIVLIKKKQMHSLVLVLPLFVFPLSAFSATRNVFLAYLSLVPISAMAIQVLLHNMYEREKKNVAVVLILIVILHIVILSNKRTPVKWYFPVNASQFVREFRLRGNMFNQYDFGGFLLYVLYPKQKVFIDGRTDVYLCCELKEYAELSLKKNLDDNQYRLVLYSFFNKYKISFVVLGTEKNLIYRRISNLLSQDPNWNLVFWDDVSEIYVKRDGNNDRVLDEFQTEGATPYQATPYRPGKEILAQKEYERMIKLVDSARSRNSLGLFLLNKKNTKEATLQFQKALTLDPTFESPYMNLAEIAVQNYDIETAISLYEEAQQRAEDRAYIYIRLGLLHKDGRHDNEKAISVWKQGLQKTDDPSAKKILEKLISSN